MPNVTATPAGQSDGSTITTFTDTVSKDPITWTYPETQDKIQIRNSGAEPIKITAGSETFTVEVNETATKEVNFTEFTGQTVNQDSAYTNQIDVVATIIPKTGAADSVPWSGITGKPSTFPPKVGTGATDAKAGNWLPKIAEVSDATTVGKALMGATDAAAARATLGTVAATTATAGIVKQAAAQANSAATDVAGLVANFNTLLTNLRAAGHIAP
ncbi:head fiber protein [Paenibacillus sp. F4]|uniref:head fiber protein n=1 Tax=Paenibacillus sp. F4 TaxID=357385 RepID=UPI001CA58E20|nr:head fiber protein [Paenibacillus sp. F4]